jgi:hypothetical protein
MRRSRQRRNSDENRTAPNFPIERVDAPHVAPSCVAFAAETNGFEAEIRRIAAHGKFAGKSKTVEIVENPTMRHM